jgi:hypothetical protein
MTTLEHISVKDSISESLLKGISYQDYRTLVQDLVEQGSTTGHDKTEALANYTILNDRRMKRWDKTIKISDETKNKISNLNRHLTWLLITESWCGDAAHVVPVIHKMAELSENIDLKLVLRDENEALMDQFLTNGGRAIPKLIIIDTTTGEVLNTFGPRPSEATQLVNDYKATHGALTPEFKEDLQSWYNKDKGQNIIDDIMTLLGQS